jgi:hypothetical protein
MDPNTSLTSQDVKLTPKNRLFLQFLSEGKSTLEAYKLSGYTGEDHAAYELKSKLSRDFEIYLTAKGMSRGDLMLAVKDLIDVPITNRQYKTLKDHMKLLSMWMKMLPVEAVSRPNITAFVINNPSGSNPPSTATPASNHVDTTVVEPNNS